MDALLAGSSRELDTLLGAYAVLWDATQNPFFSQKYKELILNLSLREFFFSGLSSDPTVGNDFMTSYLWLREQGIFAEDEQKRIEAWMLKLKDAMQFPLQEANWGRLPQLVVHFVNSYMVYGLPTQPESPTTRKPDYQTTGRHCWLSGSPAFRV